MKILIYSNMSPSDEMKYAGVFVVNQYEYLKSLDRENKYYFLAMKKTFTNYFGSIKKYFLFIIKSFVNVITNRYEVIHIHYFFPLLFIPYFSKLLYGTKVVVTVHGSDFYAKLNNSFVRYIYVFLLKKSDKIICVGKQLAFDFENKLGIKCDEILCAGVDKQIFKFEHREKKYDFLYVGSLIERKGFDQILKLIDESINKNRKWCVVGTGVYKERIREISLKYPENCIYFEKKTQRELNELYNISRWFVFPSRNEPFGLVISESIFAGTPVICTYVGGLIEQVKEFTTGFFLKDINDIDTNSNLLESCININKLEYDKMRSNCLHSNYEFSLDYVCEKLIIIYRSL